MAIFNEDIGVSLDEIASGLNEACEHISMTERRSDECEYEVEDMKIAEYMEKHIGEEYEAIIDTITKNGFFIETNNYVEGFVNFEDIRGYYNSNDDNTCVYDRKGQIIYTLGQKIKVKCIRASKETRHVDFTVVGAETWKF